MRVRTTLEFTISDDDVAEAEKNGTVRADIPQNGANNIATLLAQIAGLVADNVSGEEVV